MACILLVDDDSEWLYLIRAALPEHEVDQAQTYDGALEKLSSGAAYDVAIVDLNLLETGRDGLGGTLLEIMRDEYPSTCRIALTGLHPTAVRDVFDRFGVADLLLKGPLIELSVVRSVVERALQRYSDIPADVKVEKSRLASSLRSWKADTLILFDQRARTLENDIAVAGLAGKVAKEAVAEFRELRARKGGLTTECGALATFIANIRTHDEALQASQELERLKIIYQL